MGNKNPDPRVRAFLLWWAAEYRSRFGDSYPFNWGRDGAIVKHLLQSSDLERLQTVAAHFLSTCSTKGTHKPTIVWFAALARSSGGKALESANR